MNRQFYIYVHCRPNGEPFYVGYSGNTNRAIDLHRRHNSYHRRVVAKFGESNIIIYTRNCESENQARTHEVWMIEWCRKQGYRLTNMTDGGEGTSGLKWRDDSRRKLSTSMKGNTRGTRPRIISPEDDLAIAKLFTDGTTIDHLAAQYGVSRRPIIESLQRTGTKGKYINRHTAESRAKISKAIKGRTWKQKKPVSDAERARRSAALKGKPWSAARRAAHTQEVIDKLRKAAKRQNQNRDIITGNYTK